MLHLLRAFLNRQTLNLRKLFRSIYSSLFLSLMSPADSPPSDHSLPEFDPSQPSNPISYPIKTLEDLVSRVYFDSFHYPFNKASVPLPSCSSELPNRRRLLVCHDMAGGYLEEGDKWVQGGTNSDAYAIWHWYLIDVFVYFSHNLVTLPPPCWVNTAHKHGVKVLGTFITEWDEGKLVCDKLLSSVDYARMCAERLTELASALGFDGWLINMEVKVNASQIPNLKEFVSHLTNTMHYSKPGSLVIWYDSVTVDGDLNWQDQLNDKNKPFFDLCDGIFTNYTWKANYPKLSANVAGDRKFDVYMGIDVFGRNTYGGGKWNTNVALDVIRESDISAAIFAPGWVYETKQPPDFQTAQNRWWALIEKSWGVMQYYLREMPFYSDFDQGRGHQVSFDGRKISDADWCNLSCQSFQPYLEFPGDSKSNAIKVRVDHMEESYNGGSTITFKGDLGNSGYFTTRLFQAELILGDLAVHFSYSVKSDGNSLLGLALHLTSTNGEKVLVLLAPNGNTLLTMTRFSNKFSKVIMPLRVTNLESTKGWVLLENAVTMPGYTLTEIQAVCYKLNPTSSEIEWKKKSNYYAVLGHLLIHTPSQNVVFPPPSSWTVEGKSVNWKVGSDQSEFLSVNIVWSLKDGFDPSKYQYYIYAEKISVNENLGKNHEEAYEYLGAASVQAFYVSDLVVPSGTSSMKFYIQVCGVDGAHQQLADSPSIQLEVER